MGTVRIVCACVCVVDTVGKLGDCEWSVVTQHDSLYLHLLGSMSAYLARMAPFEMCAVNISQLVGICAWFHTEAIG